MTQFRSRVIRETSYLFTAVLELNCHHWCVRGHLAEDGNIAEFVLPDSDNFPVLVKGRGGNCWRESELQLDVTTG